MFCCDPEFIGSDLRRLCSWFLLSVPQKCISAVNYFVTTTKEEGKQVKYTFIHFTKFFVPELYDKIKQM